MSCGAPFRFIIRTRPCPTAVYFPMIGGLLMSGPRVVWSKLPSGVWSLMERKGATPGACTVAALKLTTPLLIFTSAKRNKSPPASRDRNQTSVSTCGSGGAAMELAVAVFGPKGPVLAEVNEIFPQCPVTEFFQAKP